MGDIKFVQEKIEEANKKLKIIIMDKATAEVHVFTFNPLKYATPEQFIECHYSEHGRTFRTEDCSWMVINTDVTEGRLPLYIH